MIRRRTITSYVWNSVSGNKMVILSNCIRNFFRKFELLGNSMQGENPAPDNPQEIKSAGRKSKNLLNLQKQPDVKETYLGWKVSDGRNVVLSVKDKGNNADITGCYLGLSRTGGSSDGVVWAVNNGSVAAKEVVSKNQYVSVFPSNETTVRKLLERFDVQVEYGNNATDYKPYGYLFDVKVTGKNLFDQSKLISGFINMTTGAFEESANTLFANSLILDKPILLKSGQTLVTSVDNKYAQNFLRYRTYRKDGTFLINNEPISFSYKATEDLYVIALFYNGMSEEDKKSLQIEISDDPTTYEPYTEQSVQITLDEPLRGIGEYKDTITKDGVIRKIKRVVFDGSEDEKWGIAIERENVINFVSTQFSDAIKINEHQRTMMDKLKWSSGVWGRDEVGQDMFARILRMNMPKTLTPDLQTFKTWLSQNPLTVDYVLAEPATEPLPESVQQQLQALHSENGTTHVFVDSGEVEAGINIEYKYKS